MRHRQLPPDLQDRVRRFVQYKWLATRGVDEEEILQALPLDIRREMQRHLCLNLVRRVSVLLIVIQKCTLDMHIGSACSSFGTSFIFIWESFS